MLRAKLNRIDSRLGDRELRMTRWLFPFAKAGFAIPVAHHDGRF
ncbi:hypothetical protein RE6C_01660 [Rhodopirellula europaea 6C]|uniref:Uncharacterized protein n=1 Tax=Rhodopirellula europaea 6C TaxID=1263867 RepID=M2B5W4_9BACT|nr:hypothetical protein RE6C_01660 [Rhodopirellula europaea 6C]